MNFTNNPIIINWLIPIILIGIKGGQYYLGGIQKMKKPIWLVTVLILILLITGCSSKNDEKTLTNKKSEEDAFVYGIDGDPGNSVNTITTGDRNGLMTIKAIYSPLYMYNGSEDIEYFLAESMTVSDDKKTLTAKLREDVKWHDGEPFTADDVVFTYEQMLKEENGGWARSQLIFNEKPVQVKKIDEYTVEFLIPEVSMGGIEALGNIFIMPKHIYEGEKDIATSAKNAAPVGTGPYKFKEYKAGESVSFEKNSDYYLGEPKINQIVYKIYGDANSAVVAMQKGEFDAMVISPFDVEKFKGNDNVTITPNDEGRVGYLAYNMNSKKVQDKKVRQALAYAMNKQDMIDASYLSKDFAEPAYSILPRKATYYTEDVEKYEVDVEKSKSLLKEAGVKDLTLKLAYVSNNLFNQKQAAVLQQNLKAVGVNLQLVGMDATAMFKKLETEHEEFDLFMNGYIMGIDPDTFNSLFVTGSGSNYMHYSNLKVDELFNKGRIEIDTEKRKAIYEEIQQIIIDDAAFYPIVENKRLLVIDSKVGGIEEAGLVPVYTFEDMSKLYFK